MRKIAVLFAAASIVASAAVATPANAQVVDEVVDDVRARVCVEEHGYGVVNCSETVDPYVDPVKPWANYAVGLAFWAVFGGPEIVKGQANYAYCWMVDPENTYCEGPLS